MATLSVTVIMQSGSRVENGSSSRSYRMGAEFLTHNLIEEMALEAVSRTAILFEAGIPEGGEMPVVMGAGGSGILQTLSSDSEPACTLGLHWAVLVEVRQPL